MNDTTTTSTRRNRRRPVARQQERPLVSPPRVRRWARERGLPIASRGRVPSHVVKAYRAERAATR